MLWCDCPKDEKLTPGVAGAFRTLGVPGRGCSGDVIGETPVAMAPIAPELWKLQDRGGGVAFSMLGSEVSCNVCPRSGVNRTGGE